MVSSDNCNVASMSLNDAAPNDMATKSPAATTSGSDTTTAPSPTTTSTSTTSQTATPGTPPITTTIPSPLPSNQTFPTPTSTTPFWRHPPHPLDNHRTTPTLPPTTDILIIGAGMTGISIAWHLLHPPTSHPPPSPTPNILLLEARALSSGATGRNGGHVKLPLWHANHVYEKHGAAAAAELVAFQLAHIAELGRVVAAAEEGGMEGVGLGVTRTGGEYLRTVSWDVFMAREMWERRKAEVVRLMGVEEAGLGRLVRENVQILDAGEWRREGGEEDDPIERITGVRDHAAGALAVPAASLWPYRFVCGLAERIVGEGDGKVNLQTGTRVVGVSEERDGEGYYEVRTKGRGSVRAKTVVFATNGYTAGVLPRYEGVVIPVKGTAAYARNGKGGEGQSRTNTYNIFKGNGMVDYLIHRPDGGVVLGGAREAFPSDMAQFINTVDDSTQLNELGTRKYFVDRMESAWRDWEGGGATIDKIWTGIMGSTPDGYPHIGALPGKEGQYVCVGFNGAGMPHIFLSAKGVASMIRDGKKFEEVGIPRIFKVTEERIREEWDKEKFTKPKGLRR